MEPHNGDYHYADLERYYFWELRGVVLLGPFHYKRSTYLISSKNSQRRDPATNLVRQSRLPWTMIGALFAVLIQIPFRVMG